MPGVAQGCVKVPDIVGPTSWTRFGGEFTKADGHPGPGTCCRWRCAVSFVTKVGLPLARWMYVCDNKLLVTVN